MSIKKVAEKANVSVTTVSRVLNNRGYISDKTRENVYQAMKDINYHPNELARSLSRKRTNIIGLVLPDVSHPFFSKITYLLERKLSQEGYKLLLCNTMFDLERTKDYLVMLQQSKVDGIIIGNHNLSKKEFINIDLPIVALDQNLGENIPVVCSDHVMVGKLAAEAFLKAGCKNVGQLVGYRKNDTPSVIRNDVFQQEMIKNGANCVSVEMDWNVFSNYKDKLVELLHRNPRVDGIFATDYAIAEAMVIARDMGIKIPEELKFVGIDGSDFVKFLYPSLTTIRQPYEEICSSIVKTLLALINEETIDNYFITHAVEFIKGESC